MKDNKPLVNSKTNKVRSVGVIKYSILPIIILVILVALIINPEKFGVVISYITSAFSPLVLGFCLAFVVNLLLSPIEKFWMWIWRKLKNKKFINVIKRPVCLVISFLIVIGIIFAIVFMILPALKETLVMFTGRIPQYVTTAGKWYGQLVDFFAEFGLSLPALEQLFGDKQSTEISGFQGVFSKTFDITSSIVSVVFDTVVGIVFSIYFLAQKEKLCRQCKKAVFAIFSTEKAQKTVELVNLTNNIFAKFVSGQLIEACIIGILCFIGMTIFRMPYASIISVLIGVTALVPVFGSFIGTGVGALLILFEDPIKAVWFVIFILVLQQIEGNLIYPRVVGQSVGLPGVWVLAAVTVGGALFGVWGMLFSVPICTVIYTVFKQYVNNKNKNTEEDSDVAEQTEERLL